MSSHQLDLALVKFVDALTDLCDKCAEGNDSIGNPPDVLKEQDEVEDALRELVNQVKGK